jgi:hypothetical protein
MIKCLYFTIDYLCAEAYDNADFESGDDGDERDPVDDVSKAGGAVHVALSVA